MFQTHDWTDWTTIRLEVIENVLLRGKARIGSRTPEPADICSSPLYQLQDPSQPWSKKNMCKILSQDSTNSSRKITFSTCLRVRLGRTSNAVRCCRGIRGPERWIGQSWTELEKWPDDVARGSNELILPHKWGFIAQKIVCKWWIAHCHDYWRGHTLYGQINIKDSLTCHSQKIYICMPSADETLLEGRK